MEENIDIFVCVWCAHVCVWWDWEEREIGSQQYFDFTFSSLNNNQMYRLLIFDTPIYFSHALIKNIAFFTRSFYSTHLSYITTNIKIPHSIAL